MITLTAKIYVPKNNNAVYEIDYRYLTAVNREISYRSDKSLPSYGIISNTGNLEFNDFIENGKYVFETLANQLMLNEDIVVKIFLKNTLSKTQQLVGTFETRDWDYDNNNKVVSVSLKDDLEEWQDIQVEGFEYDPRDRFKIISEGKMSNVYKWLQNSTRTPEKYQMLSFEQLDEITQNILENTTIDYPLLENGTLWEQWTKLCEVCGLYIYKNNQGKTVCNYTYGS